MTESVKIEVEMGEPLHRLVCAVSWEWENVDGSMLVGLGTDGPPKLKLRVEPIADPHGVLAESHQPSDPPAAEDTP